MAVPKEILSGVKSMQPLSRSAMQLLKLLGEPNHSIDSVMKVVQCDSVLTASILRMANSAALSRQVEVTTISRALQLLGEKLIIGIAMGLCASKVYDSSLDGYEAQKGDLWKHSLKTAIAARELAELSTSPMASDIAYTAGILHDIGKSVISAYLLGQTQDLLAGTESGEFGDYTEAERDSLDTDHTEVGEALAIYWNIPEILREVVRHHHCPAHAREEHKHLVYAVHLADILAMMSGSGTGVDTLKYNIEPDYKKYIKVKPIDIERIAFLMSYEFEKTAAVMNSSTEH